MSTILVCRDKRKRYTRIFVPLLLGTFLLAMNAFGEGKEALQGTWAFIAYEAEGVSIPEEQITAAKLQVAFLGDKMIQKCDGNVLSEATYKVEDNRTPKTIDSFTTNGTEKGIYLLEGDILTICMSKSGFPRPLNFATKVGSKQMLFRLQRILPNQTFSPVASFTDTDRIFKESSKAVVVVTAYDEKGNPVNRGSGFIVRADGAVVTNYHVIGMASDIKVTAGDKVLDVEGLIFSDEKNDLVILKAKARNMPVVKLGVVGKANIGEHVYVVSNPEGLENTISDGLLRGIRKIGDKKEIFWMTAPTSDGSSGGPVFNKDVEVIGIATSGISNNSRNLSFAMSVKMIKDKIGNKRITEIKESGLGNYENTATYWNSLGVEYSKSGSYEYAIEAYKKVVRINPDYGHVYYNLGTAYIKLGMYKQAIERLKQATNTNPDYAAVHYNLGIAYSKSGMHKEAIEAYKQAISIDHDYAAVHFNLAGTYCKLGMHKEAIEAYKQAISIDHGYAKAHYNLGVAYGKLGMYKEAVEAYKKAIRIDPDHLEAHINLSTAYGGLGMFEVAKETCKQAIRIDPSCARAYNGLGLVYFLLDDRKSAIEQYKILKSLDPELADKLFAIIGK